MNGDAVFPVVTLLLEMLILASPASLFHTLVLNQRIKLEERRSAVLTLLQSQGPVAHLGTGPHSRTPPQRGEHEGPHVSSKQLPRTRHAWCRYFLSSMFPSSSWTVVFLPTSPLHEEQPTPRRRSGVWAGSPLNPIFCITVSNNGLHVQFYNMNLGI